jgi:hypothetical protein
VFFAHGVSGLHLALAVRLVRISASSAGFTMQHDTAIYTGAVAASAEWRQVVASSLFVLLRFTAQARFGAETLTVDGLVDPNVLSIPPFGFALTAGLGWNFF